MQDLTSYWLAFLAGLLSFFSPCILPLIPVYISLVSGLSVEELRSGEDQVNKPALIKSILMFVLGFSAVYTLLGATAFTLGRLILDYSGLLSKAAGVVLMAFGLILAAGGKVNLFSSLHSRKLARRTESFFFPLVLGFGTAVGWIPCNAPLLTSALSAAAVAGSPAGGLMVSFIYSLGIGIPFILAGLALGKFLSLFSKYKQYLPAITFLSGIFLIICGALMFLGGTMMFSRLMRVF